MRNLQFKSVRNPKVNNFALAFIAGTVALMLVSVSASYAQAPPGIPNMQEITGKYVDQASGVQITFPDGWSGYSVPYSSGVMVATAQGGMSGDSQTMKSIVLVVSDKSTNKDPRNPSSFANDVNNCDAPTIVSRTVAGVQGTEATVNCPSTSQKFRMVAVETPTHWVAVMYMTPTADFDSQIGSFDSAVSSLQVNGAINTQGQPTTQTPTTSKMSVMVQGKPIDVSINSASTISAMKLDEASKTLSFKADGTGTQTSVAVGSVLQGPFTVMVDGNAVQAQQSQDSGVSMLTIPYASGSHTVTISGTQVVPEFPLASVGILAAVIGMIAILGRTNAVKRFF